MNPLPLIIKREYLAQMTQKSTIWSMIISVALIIGAGVVYSIFFSDSDENDAIATVAVSEEMAPLTDTYEAAGLEVVPVEGSVENTLENVDDVTAVIEGTPEAPVISTSETDQVVEVIQSIVGSVSTDTVLSDNLDPETYQQIQSSLATAMNPEINMIMGDNIEFDGMKFFVALATVMILYMAVVMGISMLSVGIVEEKTSRIVEILLATIRPRQLLLGKVIGIGAAVLTVVAIYLASGVIAASIAGLLPDLDLLSSLPMIILWVFLGYFLYASLTGGLASTITRQEEIGAITTPIIMTTLIPFYLAMFLVPEQPDSTLVLALSFVPFFAPFMMPFREAFVDVPLWQNGLAVAICLVTIPILAVISGKIYQRSILHTGERKKVLSALTGK